MLSLAPSHQVWSRFLLPLDSEEANWVSSPAWAKAQNCCHLLGAPDTLPWDNVHPFLWHTGSWSLLLLPCLLHSNAIHLFTCLTFVTSPWVPLEPHLSRGPWEPSAILNKWSLDRCLSDPLNWDLLLSPFNGIGLRKTWSLASTCPGGLFIYFSNLSPCVWHF